MDPFYATGLAIGGLITGIVSNEWRWRRNGNGTRTVVAAINHMKRDVCQAVREGDRETRIQQAERCGACIRALERIGRDTAQLVGGRAGGGG